MPDQVRERRGAVFGSEDCEVRRRTDRSPSRLPRIAYAAIFGSSPHDQSQESLVASSRLFQVKGKMLALPPESARNSRNTATVK